MFSIRSAQFVLFHPIGFWVFFLLGIGTLSFVSPEATGLARTPFWIGMLWFALYFGWPLMLIRHCDQFAPPNSGMQAMLPIVWYVMIFAGAVAAEQIEQANPDNREAVEGILIGVTLVTLTGWLMLAWSGAAALIKSEGGASMLSRVLTFLGTLVLPAGIFFLSRRIKTLSPGA